jgi:hypothetical protein
MEQLRINISDYSEEILFHIFSHLQPKDLTYVCRACKKFNEVGSDNVLWEGHFLERYRKKESYLFDVLDEFSRDSKVEYEVI